MFKKLFGSLLGNRDTKEATSVESPPNFEQRRKTARRACDIEVELAYGRSEYLGTVVDLSAGGLCIQCNTPFKIKGKGVLKVTYPEALGKQDVITIETIPKWNRLRERDGNQFIGVEYADPKKLGRSWVKVQMQELGFRPYNIKEQRKDFRLECSVPAVIELESQKLDCTIRNFGLGGFLVEVSKPMRAGSIVTVQTKEGSLFSDERYSVAVRHLQHPDPTSPFGHGLSFQKLSEEQMEALKDLLARLQKEKWEKRTLAYVPEYGGGLSGDNEQQSHLSDVEIPDLASILEETKDVEHLGEEPEEDDEGEEGEDDDSSEEPESGLGTVETATEPEPSSNESVFEGGDEPVAASDPEVSSESGELAESVGSETVETATEPEPPSNESVFEGEDEGEAVSAPEASDVETESGEPGEPPESATTTEISEPEETNPESDDKPDAV